MAKSPLSYLTKDAKFGCHRHCGSGNLMFSAFHVIFQDHMVKGSCELIGRSPLR